MKTWTRILLFFVIDFRVCFFYIRLLGSLRLRRAIIISIINAQLSTRLFSWVLFFPDLGHAVMPLTYTLYTSDSFTQIFFAFRPFIKWLYFIYYFLSINQVDEIVVVITLFCYLFWLTFAKRFRFQFQMEIIMDKTFFQLIFFSVYIWINFANVINFLLFWIFIETVMYYFHKWLHKLRSICFLE